MQKEQADKLEKYAISKLLEAGFVLTPGKRYCYSRTGSLGEVGVTIWNDKSSYRRGYRISLVGMFYDADKANAAGIDCNNYSGKYNYHFIETEQTIDFMISKYAKEGI